MRMAECTEEYWFVGLWKNPHDNKDVEIVAVVPSKELNPFLTGVMGSAPGQVYVHDRMEGGGFLAKKELLRWTRVEVHKKD